jgi:type I restriction enzyme S subunit
VVYHKYLFYYLKSDAIQKESLQKIVGVGRANLSLTNLGEFEIPIAPLEQQKRIVAEIEKQFSRLDEAVANLKRVKANLKRYKAAVLKAAVEGKLTEEWRKQHPAVEPADKLLERILEERRANWQGRGSYKEPVAPDTTGLPELPEGWIWSSAEQICGFITKGTTPKAPKLHDSEGDIRFLKVYNLTFSGALNYNYKPVFVDHEVHQNELSRSKVLPEDVLINIVGPPLGQVSVVPPEISEANINQAIARFRPLNGVLYKFIAITLMTTSVMSWATKRAKTTAGQSNLTLALCRELPIPLASLAEQNQVIAEVEQRLSIVSEVEAQVDVNLRRADRLRQSILKQAFFGKLND